MSDTIAQQCLTKIYLADESATSPGLMESHRYFGLTDSEILALSNATMKRDYYFKNPNGCRMFTLDLDAFQLALIFPDHEMLDKLEAAKGRNTMVPLAFDILEATRQKMTDLGRDTRGLEYEKYKRMLEE